MSLRWNSIVVVLALCGSVRATEFDDILASFGNLDTVAGAGLADSGGNEWNINMEGGLATAAELSRPHMTMADRFGNLYIADKDAHGIRLVTPDGLIVTVAGTNTGGFNGDGPANEKQLNFPNGLYTFPDGTTFILDLFNGMIRRLGTDGQLTTVVSDPDGISTGRGLWVSADESSIFYSSGSRIRLWTADGSINTYADGFAALGNIDFDPLDGNLVATDRSGHVVYKVFPDGTKTIIAGNGTTTGGGNGQDATATGLNEVRGVFFDTTGGYYVGTHRDSDVWYVDTDGIIHMLIAGYRDDDTHAGDGFPLTTPGLKISEPRSVTLAPDRDLLITENDRGFVRHVSRALNVAGDFDYDGELTAHDIELLTQVVNAGVHPFTFNLDDELSRFVNEEDRRIWIEDLAGTNFGDANLDGIVNASDLNVVGINWLGTADWAGGDFTGDGIVNAADLNVLGINWQKGVAAAAPAVPEPATATLAVLSLLVFMAWRSSLQQID